MDSVFREIAEQKIKASGLFVLETDKTLHALVGATQVSFNGKTYALTYLDNNGDVLYEASMSTNQFPRLGAVTEVNTRRRYLNEYEKEKLQVVKFKCNKEKDADILAWVDRQDNLQGTLKQLIRKQIENERYENET